MILEEETFEALGYYPSKLSPKNAKYILVTCELCGKFRIVKKEDYRSFCRSCSNILGEKNKEWRNPNFGKPRSKETKAKIGAAHIGLHHTEEAKALMSKNHADVKGENNPMFGKHLSEDRKALLSAMMKGKKHPRWNGGKKVVAARKNAKRKQLGYTLLMPLAEGEVGHHVTDEYVIGIPADIHNSIGGRRSRHRMNVLQWLKANDKKKYRMVLSLLI